MLFLNLAQEVWLCAVMAYFHTYLGATQLSCKSMMYYISAPFLPFIL
jgi:hypothetical protein